MISIPDLAYEKEFWQSGLKLIAGLDEAGRGALAGPVVVGAVILPDDSPHLTRTLSGVRDSKQVTSLARARLAPRIRNIARAWAVERPAGPRGDGHDTRQVEQWYGSS